MVLKRSRYRIVEKRDGYYPQFCKVYFRVINIWYKIAKHPDNQFGLYSESNTDYPKTFEQALDVVKDFYKWKNKSKIEKITYVDVEKL